MQRRLITVILFALVAAFVSSTVLYRIISANSAQASTATAQIFVAARDLKAGTMLGGSDIREVKWPGTANPLWVSRRGDLVGRGLSVAINAGEPFPVNRLLAKGAAAGFASGIPQGMRVVAVHVDELSGLARLIGPGMHVDVLSTGSTGGDRGPNASTRTILQNVKVLSTDQSADSAAKEKAPSAQAVNLLVSPQQAVVLSQAIAQTRIQLVLRNPLDESSIAEVIANEIKPTVANFRRVALPAPAPVKKAEVAEAPKPAPPAPPTIEIVQGSKRTVTVVPAVSSQESIQ